MLDTFSDSYIRWQGDRGRCVEKKKGAKKRRGDYEAPWHRRWSHSGEGRVYKRAYHKARRQANRREFVTGVVGKRIGYASECKWKRH